MTVNVQKTFKNIARLISVCASVFCVSSTYADDFLLDDFSDYGISENSFHKMQIIPTSAMDNETLFLAAEAQRDTSMNMSQRLINNRWLLNDNKHSYSGTEALRRYLRLYFLHNWKNKQKSKKENSPLLLPVVKQHEPSPFLDLSNYRLRVSDDKVRLKFKYKFD